MSYKMKTHKRIIANADNGCGIPDKCK